MICGKPHHIAKRPPAFSVRRVFFRPKPHERLAFFRAYALLERAGVDFGAAFALLAEHATSPRMRDALRSIRIDVERNGEKLWSAMQHRPDEFTDLEIAMVAAGEESGNREDVFERLATFLERDARVRKKLSSALFYPALVLFSALCVTVYLVSFVIPQFAALFDSFGVPQSKILTFFLSATRLATNPIAIVVAVSAGTAIVMLAVRSLRTAEGALAFDALRLRVPFVGPVVRKSIVARVCRVVSALLQSGVQQVRALEIAVPVAESPVYSRAIDRARERISDGRSASLEEALREAGVFPALLLGFIRVGSTAGNVPVMLSKIAEYYEDDVDALLTAVPAIVQTAVTLVLGLVVGAIVYVVYVPLSTLSSSIH